jgi:chemotaxis family two-component system response regulator Rcp1
MQVLLIDDNPGDIRLTQEAFKSDGLAGNLTVVQDGVEASDFLWRRGAYVAAIRPDLILLDLNLPKKTGRELLRELKSDPDLRRIPVMVLTTSRAEQDLRKAYNLHANGYIAKPDGLDQFIDAVRSIQHFWCNVVTLPSD